MNRNNYTTKLDNHTLSTIDTPIILLIEYKIAGFGTDADFDKRWKIQAFAHKVLLRTGLGECDGGSMGGNTMEICCYVKDFEVARSILAKALALSPYSDYYRIVEENKQYWDELNSIQNQSKSIKSTEQDIQVALLREL